ncbi:hypothetical protein D9M71_656190 [compost metagenome]
MAGVEGRQADAQADFQGRILFVAQGCEAVTQGVHGRGGAAQGQVGKDHAELVATITPGHVGGPQVLLEHLAQLAQHDVTGHMAVGVIDAFEVVNVDQRDSAALMLTLAALELDFQLILPGAVIEQAGQAVGAAQGQ